MKSVIKYRIFEIVEGQGYDGKTGKYVPQKEAKMAVVYTSDPEDPNYNYGQLSSGSTQNLKTINPDVFNTWKVGSIVECEMTVTGVE